MKIVLYYLDGVLPKSDRPTLGPDLRGLQIVQALKAAGYSVVVSQDVSRIPRENRHYFTADEQALAHSTHGQQRIFDVVQPDMVYYAPWVALRQQWHPPVPTVVEVGGPMALEVWYHGEGDAAGAFSLIKAEACALAHADAVVCYGTRQRNYIFAILALAGWSPEAMSSVMVVPPAFTVRPESPPQASSPDDGPTFAVTGLLHAWTDPTWACGVIARCIERYGKGRILCLGGYAAHAVPYRARFDAILGGLGARAEVRPRLPADAYVAALREVDIGIECFAPNAERELAIAYRTHLALACGIAPIYAADGELAPVIGRADAGLVVRHGDDAALATLVTSLFENGRRLAELKANARELVRTTLTPEAAARPLVEWCRQPANRAGKRASPMELDEALMSQRERRLVLALRNIPGARMLRRMIRGLVSAGPGR